MGRQKYEVTKGQIFGLWEVIDLPPFAKTMALCECVCGVKKTVNKRSLVSGESKSCGCAKNHWRSGGW